MHLIKDENGNLVQHGHEHTHEHTHADGVSHTHAHTHEGSEGHDHTHTDEQNCGTGCGSCQGMDAAAKTIKESVSDFQKGNMRLGLALTLVKEEMK